jgi:hypothetical protein
MTETTLTPTRLWKRMSVPQRLATARAFWLEEEATDDQIQAVMLIAQQKKFRPKSVIALDVDRKAKHLASIVNLPDGLAARVLIVYHLAEQRPMMAAFLDALGVAHENGLIQEDSVVPDPEKLGPAVEKLRESFSADDVALYLDTLLSQDPQTWGGLAGLSSHESPAAGGPSSVSGSEAASSGRQAPVAESELAIQPSDD